LVLPDLNAYRGGHSHVQVATILLLNSSPVSNYSSGSLRAGHPEESVKSGAFLLARRHEQSCRPISAIGKNSALEPHAGCIVWGCWDLERKLRINLKSNFNDRAVVTGDAPAF